MIIISSIADMNRFISENGLSSFIGAVVMAGDLLADVRANGNVFEIVEPVDDGAWLEIDNDGNVIGEGNIL